MIRKILYISSIGMLIIPQLLAVKNPLHAKKCLESTSPECEDNTVFNGYWWNDGWVPFYPSLESWFTPAPVWSEGTSLFYAPGPMLATAHYRGLKLTGYKGGVALMSPADIGQQVWIKPPKGEWDGPYLVVDTARRGDIFPMIKYRHEVIEVDWDVAQKWGMVSKSGDVHQWRLDHVQVSKLPPEELTGCPLDYVSWWLDQVTPADPVPFIATPYYRSPPSWRLNGEWVTFPSPNQQDLHYEQEEFKEYLNCNLE